ncbi:MAG TPA: polysaccharide pyruvyl transferase CsaB [Clostridiales bacterium]|mgnify:CR=1 FL=1|nr:polysaccharide pyruvyl transferase CsaB [Clostridiales bacterium]
MRVLHLIGGGDIGGAKTHVLHLVKELGKYVDVKIVSFRPGIFADEAKEMGIDVEVVKKGNVFKDIKRVAQIVKEGGYQIIHSHGAKANMIAIIVKRLTHVSTVTTVHSDYRLDYMHSIVKSLTFGIINTVSLRFMDFYIGVSKNFKEMLISRKFNPINIFTVYNGVDFNSATKEYSREIFKEKYKTLLNNDDIIVGIAARLYPVKSISTLIDAAKVVADKNPKVKFIIGGDGEERQMLENKAASLGLLNNVFFTGWLNDPYELMGIVDISVLTSISESFAYSILEGARFKKATISTCVGGIPDLIESGENGYLFNPGDHIKLAEYILELANDKEKRDTMGEKIYQKARSMFSLDNMCRTQLNIYETILKRSAYTKETKLTYDLVIAGYYGFNNIGDEALLMAIIQNLKVYIEDIKIIVLSNNPLETKLTYGVNAINRFNMIKIVKAMRKSRMFMYGGGTLIQENTSTRSLIYYLGMIWAAKKAGLKVMLYANGIEPINKYINKRLTGNIMNRVDIITLREQASKTELEKLSINKPEIIVTADPAFTLAPSKDSETERIFIDEGIGIDGPFIGFSARKWDGYKKYVDVIARSADYVVDQYGAKPVFIPMQQPEDLLIIKSIVAKMKHRGYIFENKYNVSQVMGITSKLDMLIGMRLHALIFAVSLGIPVVGLVYEPKVAWFLDYIDQVDSSAGDVKTLEFERLKQVIDYTWLNKTEIKEHLKKVTVELKDKSVKNAKIAVAVLTKGEG